ncbi:MAG: flagellar filament capping protein FliD [Gammaproteobacteria bacterium]|nr:flagellar filament capping protein FliD [Gammaproteobacteria bacterium]
MASISSAGIGSGLDVPALVEKLVNAEGDPIRSRLDRKEAKLQAGLSAIGTLKSALSEFQSSLGGFQKMESLQSMAATSDDEGILTVTASNNAQEGEYEIDVEELARSQRLVSIGFDSDFMPLGSGSLRIQFGTYNEDNNDFKPNPKQELRIIEIQDDRSSLRDIQKAINDSKIGLKASVIKDGEVYRLVLTSEHEGTENSIRISVQDDDGENLDMVSLSMLSFDPTYKDGKGRNMVESQTARDAEIEIDGLTVFSSSNEVDDVIDGLTISLKDTGSADIEVKLNQIQVVERIQSLVQGHNNLIDAVSELSGFDPESRIAGPLNGDSTVRTVMNQVRRIMSSSFAHVNHRYQSLADIGITTQSSTGKLTINQSKLQRSIEEDLEEVINLFSKSGRTDDPQINYLKASDRTASGTYPINITQKPTKGGYAGIRLDRSSFPFYVQESNDEFIIKVNGVKSGPIKLDHGVYYSGHELADEIQEKVNQDANLVQKEAKIWTSFYDRRLIIISEKLGSGSSIELVSGDYELQEEMGLSLGRGQDGEDIKGSIGTYRTLGTGNVLTGQQDIDGLQIEFLGGGEGHRGKIVYSEGVAAQMDQLINGFLQSQGVIQSRVDGYGERLTDIEQERRQLARKLEKSEERYLKQFTKLDALIGSMNSTSQYLNNQLKALPGARSTSRN